MRLRRAATCVLAAFLVSCSDQTTQTRAIGEAYVAPATLMLRQELTPKAAVSATVKHGDKLQILEYKRRFVKVRTAQGAEGWTDNRQLLTPAQMAALRSMAESASKYPSQGAATVFEPLNIHTEPNRASPSFWQIPDNVSVDVIGHKLSPRSQPLQLALAPTPPAPRVARRKSRGRQSSSKIAPPPAPPAPKPPENWLELSVPKEEPSEAPPADTPKTEAKAAGPVPSDDWSLIRTKEGKVGWVLTRALSMAIPDEVAQYAEGHRITSYFALGQVRDGDTVKNNWLWTTITKGREPYEFDSFRVFVWSKKHHRYETAYIERKVVGHFPVLVNNSGAVPSFSLVVEGDDGGLLRKTYSFEGYRVRMVNKVSVQAAPQPDTPPPAAAPPPQAPQERSWSSRIKSRLRRLFH